MAHSQTHTGPTQLTRGRARLAQDHENLSSNLSGGVANAADPAAPWLQMSWQQLKTVARRRQISVSTITGLEEYEKVEVKRAAALGFKPWSPHHQKTASGLRPKCEYLGDSGVLFFCFFRNFKAVLMSFVFKASIQIFSFRFSDFLLLASARAGPEGPAQGWP